MCNLNSGNKSNLNKNPHFGGGFLFNKVFILYENSYI